MVIFNYIHLNCIFYLLTQHLNSKVAFDFTLISIQRSCTMHLQMKSFTFAKIKIIYSIQCASQGKLLLVFTYFFTYNSYFSLYFYRMQLLLCIYKQNSSYFVILITNYLIFLLIFFHALHLPAELRCKIF